LAECGSVYGIPWNLQVMVNLQLNSASVMIWNPMVGNSLDYSYGIASDITDRMNNKLFVGNLSFNVTENELQDTFAQYGTVLEANLMTDRMTGRPRGFGFVTMSSEEEAQKAIEALNGSQLDNRALTVNIARPREDRPGGGGGGGGRERRGGGGGGYGGGGGGGRERRGGGGGGDRGNRY
jgi:RNA recognition motif-containing protein